jgi:RHS repeat-associated protein
MDAANKVAWQWAYSAFGDNAPSGLIALSTKTGSTTKLLKATAPAITLNLRYPGQYFDAESGLNDNYHRTYAPTQGRYVQADPIGLDGGWNRFGYVDGNPLSRTDRLGLATDQEIRNAVATLRCANPGEFNRLARSITMADMGENGAGVTDWRNNITLNSKDYGDRNTPVDSLGPYQGELFLQTLAHEMLHVNEGSGSRLLSNSFRMGNPLGYFHRQLDEKAAAMVTSAVLKQFRDAMSSGDAGCTCSR